MELKIGTKVILKSGGPVMTVHKSQLFGTYLCKWFDDNGDLQEQEFYPQMLIIVNE